MRALIELGTLIFGVCGLLWLIRRPAIRVWVRPVNLPSPPVAIGVIVVVIAIAAYGG